MTPNILVVLTDEERERVWTPEGFRLPARDGLAARGLRGTQHHIHAQPCTPSRSTIVTGRHVAHTGMGDNINFAWQRDLRPASEGGLATWGTMLRTAGYRTSWLGKWHLGGVDRGRGLSQYGFDDWVGPDVHGVPLAGRIHDRSTAQHAVRWLDAAPTDRPWLLVVSFVNPHDIWLEPRFRDPRIPKVRAPLPDTLDDDLSDKPSVHRRWSEVCDMIAGRVRTLAQWQRIADHYLGLQLEVDGHVGAVLEALERRGAVEDTVVVCTSDHGDMAGAHGLRQKGPFIYREAVNVPLTIAWPGRTDPGRTTSSLTAAIDLAPTLCEVAGLDAEESRARWSLPGRSLVPLLDDPSVTVRDEVLFTADAHSSMGPDGLLPGFLRGCTNGRWKFARYFEPGAQHAPLAEQEIELYDLVADPCERHNLARRPGYGPVMAERAASLDRLIAAEVGEDRFVPDSPTGVPRPVRALQRANAVIDRLRPMPSPALVAAPPANRGDAPLGGVVASVATTIERLAAPGEPMWPNATLLVADVPVDAAAARTWLPPGLRLPERPTARLFVADYPTTSFGVAYREVGVLLHATTARRRTPVLHCCWMVVDDDSAMIYGRELLGFPKKLADIELTADVAAGTPVGASVVRRGQKLLTVDGVVGARLADPTPLLDRPVVNVWGLPGPLPAVLLRMTPPEHVHEGHQARLRIRLTGGDHDPLAPLGMTDVEVIGQVLCTDLATPTAAAAASGALGPADVARFVAPLRLIGPRWVAQHFLARSR